MKKKLFVLGAAIVAYALIGGRVQLNGDTVQTLAALGLLIGMVSGNVQAEWKDKK